MISNWFRGSSCFCESETDRRIVRCVCACAQLRLPWFCPSGFLSHREAATRIHAHGAHGLQRARRKESKSSTVGSLIFSSGGGVWGVGRGARADCENLRESGAKKGRWKGEEWEEQKDLEQEDICRASEKTEQGEELSRCCNGSSPSSSSGPLSCVLQWEGSHTRL